jgi:hypothetical protein
MPGIVRANSTAQPKVGFCKVPRTEDERGFDAVVTSLRMKSFDGGEIAGCYKPLKSSCCRYRQVPLMVTHQG